MSLDEKEKLELPYNTVLSFLSVRDEFVSHSGSQASLGLLEQKFQDPHTMSGFFQFQKRMLLE